jgi:hypothetical protein
VPWKEKASDLARQVKYRGTRKKQVFLHGKAGQGKCLWKASAFESKASDLKGKERQMPLKCKARQVPFQGMATQGKTRQLPLQGNASAFARQGK